MHDLWLRACRYTPFIKLYMTVLQHVCYVKEQGPIWGISPTLV